MAGDSAGNTNPSQLISNQIASLDDCRGALLAQLRSLVLEAVPGMTEEWKWDTAGWSHKGMVCSAGVFKDHVKLNFFKGTSLADPHGLFNAGLEAKISRAIDFNEGDPINAPALADLIRAAAAYNQSSGAKK